MRISPIVSTPFRGSFDLGEKIKDALSKKLSEKMGNMGSDEFVPSTPSSPIMVDKIEIHQGEKGAKAALKTGGLAAGGAATGYGVGDLVTKKESSIHKLFNGEDDDVHTGTGHDEDGPDVEHPESDNGDDFNPTNDGDDDFDDDDIDMDD